MNIFLVFRCGGGIGLFTTTRVGYCIGSPIIQFSVSLYSCGCINSPMLCCVFLLMPDILNLKKNINYSVITDVCSDILFLLIWTQIRVHFYVK